MRRLDERRHTGESIAATAADQPLQDGFRLILRVMTEQKVQDGVVETPPAQQSIASDARFFLKGVRWILAQPAEDAMLDSCLAISAATCSASSAEAGRSR